MSSVARERLSEDSFEEETFDKLDLVGADLSRKEFVQCVFRNCRMQDIVWNGARFEDSWC